MKTASAVGLVALVTLAGGCAGPGVLRDLPDPVFAAPRQWPVPPPAAVPQPFPPSREPSPRPMGAVTIVVDAGHGGKDPGALGVGPLPEKTININVAMKLARLLEQRGAHVVNTRDSDRFITLDGRAALAERTRAHLFVSIHADAAPRAGVTGATVYIARNAHRESVQAAESILAALERAGIECRGIRRAGFRVLVGHSRPAVLVECGYLTNRAEAQRLSTPSYQAHIAEAVAEGIADHFSR